MATQTLRREHRGAVQIATSFTWKTICSASPEHCFATTRNAPPCAPARSHQEGSPERHITIRPDSTLGQPGQLAHKIFVALIKKTFDYAADTNEISFTRRDIGRLIGRRNGRQRQRAAFARPREIHYTFITTRFRRPRRYVEHSFNIFPKSIERREFASDPIEACTVSLAARSLTRSETSTSSA